MVFVIKNAMEVILPVLRILDNYDSPYNVTVTKDNEAVIRIPDSDDSNGLVIEFNQFRMMARTKFRYDLGDIIALQVTDETDKERLMKLLHQYLDFDKNGFTDTVIEAVRSDGFLSDTPVEKIREMIFKANKERHSK